MARVAIVTDSSADLDAHVAAREGITVLPASIRLGAGALRTPVPALRTAAAWPDAPKREISAVGSELVETFTRVFADLAETHDGIVAILLSRRLGSVVEAAYQARERVPDLPPVEIVDSRSASLGLGFQALRAAELAREGASAEAVANDLRSVAGRYHVVFLVESVEHLRRSGQIGRSAALIAETLQLKPLLRIDEGQIVPYELARTRVRAIAALAAFVRDLPAVERCGVLYATNSNDARRLAGDIAADTGRPADRITVAEIGDAIAAQIGPGALGVAVVEPDPAANG